MALVAQDAEALVALRREALESQPLAFSASPEDDRGLSIDFARAALEARERGAVFGLFDGERLAGMVGVVRAAERKRQHRSHLWGMYVSPRARRIDATDPTGVTLNLADGGFTDWTRRLLSNAKERLLVSGLGIELLPKRFRGGPPGP